MSILTKLAAAAAAAGAVFVPSNVMLDAAAAAGAAASGAADAVRTAASRAAATENGMTAYGRVVAAQSVGLAFEQPGRLVWAAEPGAAVRAGEPVLRLDAARASAAVEVARAELRRAELHLRHAQTIADRTARLAERSTATRNSLTDAVMDRDLARADLESARAALADAELDLEGRTLRAPFDGTIARSSVQIAEYVEDGTEIVRFECLSGVEVHVELPTSEALRLRKGEAVRVAAGASATAGAVRQVLPFVGERASFWGGPEPFGLVKIAIPDGASAPGLPATVFFGQVATD